jgi:homoserine O-succinyltransferase/O-acetyltransferase
VTVRLAQVADHDVSFIGDADESASLTCAFVNDMPDGAFDATERQFLGLLDQGSGSDVLEVRRYALAGVPRGEETSRRIAEQYFPLTDLYLRPPDVLVVTGSNPIEAHIVDEPYWDDLEEMLTWARAHVGSMLLSCLSAHAALHVFDGIARIHLPVKCTGVFAQDVDVSHDLAAGIESEILLPHSRWNSVPQEFLEGAGYDIILGSQDTGWGVAAREENGHRVVLVQGHPEYDPSSLLREYRRDAGRYVRGERDDLPFLPYHCASTEDWPQLEQVQREIIHGKRDPHLIDGFPFDEVGDRAPWPWHSMATRFYANWLSSVGPRKS